MSVVGDDDEEACVKRVVSTCNIPSQRDAVVKPLQEFARTKLHLPLMLHPMPQVTLIELSRVLSSGSSSMRTLVDVISFIQSKLEDNFPFSWVMFCSDVSDVFVCKGHFIETSGEAGPGLRLMRHGRRTITCRIVDNEHCNCFNNTNTIRLSGWSGLN